MNVSELDCSFGCSLAPTGYPVGLSASLTTGNIFINISCVCRACVWRGERGRAEQKRNRDNTHLQPSVDPRVHVALVGEVMVRQLTICWRGTIAPPPVRKICETVLPPRDKRTFRGAADGGEGDARRGGRIRFEDLGGGRGRSAAGEDSTKSPFAVAPLNFELGSEAAAVATTCTTTCTTTTTFEETELRGKLGNDVDERSDEVGGKEVQRSDAVGDERAARIDRKANAVVVNSTIVALDLGEISCNLRRNAGSTPLSEALEGRVVLDDEVAGDNRAADSCCFCPHAPVKPAVDIVEVLGHDKISARVDLRLEARDVEGADAGGGLEVG